MTDIEDALTAVQHLEDDRTGNHLSDEEHIAATTAIRKALQEPEYGWGIRVDGYGTIAFNEDGQEEHARQFAARAPEYNLVRRTVGPWEDA